MADRTALVAARVTPAEHAAWRDKAAAAGVSPSALLREAMARTHTWTAAARSVERKRTRQIARIGSRLSPLYWTLLDRAAKAGKTYLNGGTLAQHVLRPIRASR